MNKAEITEILQAQREYFMAGYTTHPMRGRALRTNMLADLHNALLKYEQPLLEALQQDLGKSEYEAYTTEFIPVMQELDYVFKKGGAWFKEKTLMANKLTAHGTAKITYIPKGCVLIIAPWNYPLQLAVLPLVSAIAAGNCCVVKPSEQAPATAQVLEKMINSTFKPEYVRVINGDAETAQALVAEPFDHIFFTGSQQVGRQVMAAAAQNLTPVTLELGGKSPCIVDSTANLPLAARRIVFGKYLNCGQTCVAPDYLLCHRSVKDRLLSLIKLEITRQFELEPLKNPNYGRIVNEKHFDRLTELLKSGDVVHGGGTCRDTMQIEPTVLDAVPPESPVMEEEIFGPLLPVLAFETLKEAVTFVNARPHPLALYLFTGSRDAVRMVTSRCGFGGGCVNDTVIHLATSHMGFGGFRESGMGAYHGKAGFDAFTHYKSIVDKKTWLDLPMRYQPYTGVHEKLIRFFLR